MNKIIPILGVITILLAGVFILINLDKNVNTGLDGSLTDEMINADAETVNNEIINEKSASLMRPEEAREIAESSYCVDDGNLAETHIYNSVTETYWFDLIIENGNCNPACVVDVNTKTASINWRCTGLLME